MWIIKFNIKFQEDYKKLPKTVQNKLQKQENFFRQDPFHPSLNVEKLEPKQLKFWSFRVDKSYRVLFRFLDEKTVVLLRVGPHDWIYRLPF